MLPVNMFLLVGHVHIAFHGMVQRYGMAWNKITYHTILLTSTINVICKLCFALAHIEKVLQTKLSFSIFQFLHLVWYVKWYV